MNRKEFGKLLAVLRKEQRDHQNNIFTQAKLAKETGLSEVVIGNLERGSKEKLDPDILLKLANALHLTTQERKEFILAASNVDETQLYQAENLIQQALDSLVSILEQLRTPAYISDGFGNLIYVNDMALAVYYLQLDALQNTSSDQPARYNLMRLLFAPEFAAQRNMLGTTWPAFAQQTMLLFRTACFRFQAHPYFREQLLPELNNAPLFRQFWQAARAQKDDLFTNFSEITLDHPEWGALKFASSPLRAATPFGDLTLYAFHALGAETVEICFKISGKAGTSAIPLAPWPHPSLLEEPSLL